MNARFGLASMALFALLQACHSAGGTRTIPMGGSAVGQALLSPSAACVARNVAAPSSGSLFGVTAFSTSTAFAVGVGSRAPSALIERWNGTSWTHVTSPAPGTSVNVLHGVAGSGPNDVWTVGYLRNGAALEQPLILHSNGVTWSAIGSPSLTNSRLLAVAAQSTRDAWAVGRNGSKVLVEHWNGTNWSIGSAPVPAGTFSAELDGITKAGTRNYIAVGRYCPSRTGCKSLTELWNGSAWVQKTAPNFGSFTFLLAASGIAAGDVWAIGDALDNNGLDYGIAMHWNGSTWKGYTLPKPDPVNSSGEDIQGVAEVSANNAWAVGADGNKTDGAYAEHWNGSAWSLVPVVHPVSTGDSFSAAASIPGTNQAWAVGEMGRLPLTPLTENLHC